MSDIDFDAAVAHAQDLAAARGAGDPETVKAWVAVAEDADLECEWAVVRRAWQAVVDAPIAGGDATDDLAMQRARSAALRGLGARELADHKFGKARALFERDLELRRRMHAGPDVQIAVSLDSVAVALEQLGQRDQALAVRRDQRATLVAAGASESQLKLVDDRIARLS